MMDPSLVVRLKGGLGNQMFQYAAGRALAARNGVPMSLDTTSGFIRDTVYRRSYSLSEFPIAARKAGLSEQAPFWLLQARRRCGYRDVTSVNCSRFGTFLYETELEYLNDIASYRMTGKTWMEGYWQSECYFDGYRNLVAQELTPPQPSDRQFLKMAERIQNSNSVAVGVRLFEEVPGMDKAGVGGVVPYSFYEKAAERIPSDNREPTFFVFSTRSAAVEGKLRLPGDVTYVTHDKGYEGAVQRLWLISQCRHHILSNSSFYWWGAWLSEQRTNLGIVAVCDSFPNRSTIPDRWLRYQPD